eukprot:SAG22_NODE_136_length_18095_cov_19.897255_16_plen_134_part_00
MTSTTKEDRTSVARRDSRCPELVLSHPLISSPRSRNLHVRDSAHARPPARTVLDLVVRRQEGAVERPNRRDGPAHRQVPCPGQPANRRKERKCAHEARYSAYVYVMQQAARAGAVLGHSALRHCRSIDEARGG